MKLDQWLNLEHIYSVDKVWAIPALQQINMSEPYSAIR